MTKWECPVCHGTYIDPAADGHRYYHACAPLSEAELKQLSDDALRALLPDVELGATREQLLRLASSRTIERPGKRDENIRPDFRYPPRSVSDESPWPDPPAIQDQPPRIPRGDL